MRTYPFERRTCLSTLLTLVSQIPHQALQRIKLADLKAHDTDIQHIECPTCPLISNSQRTLLNYASTRKGKGKPLALDGFCHKPALSAILQYAQCREPEKYSVVRVCNNCYTHLRKKEGGYARYEFRNEVIYQVPEARQSAKQRAGDPALSVLTSAGRSRARSGHPAYIFKDRKPSEHWQPLSPETARVKFPLLSNPLPFANAELADGYVKLAPDTRDFTKGQYSTCGQYWRQRLFPARGIYQQLLAAVLL